LVVAALAAVTAEVPVAAVAPVAAEAMLRPVAKVSALAADAMLRPVRKVSADCAVTAEVPLTIADPLLRTLRKLSPVADTMWEPPLRALYRLASEGGAPEASLLTLCQEPAVPRDTWLSALAKEASEMPLRGVPKASSPS
jgi:hypothetical protein